MTTLERCAVCRIRRTYHGVCWLCKQKTPTPRLCARCHERPAQRWRRTCRTCDDTDVRVAGERLAALETTTEPVSMPFLPLRQVRVRGVDYEVAWDGSVR